MTELLGEALQVLPSTRYWQLQRDWDTCIQTYIGNEDKKITQTAETLPLLAENILERILCCFDLSKRHCNIATLYKVVADYVINNNNITWDAQMMNSLNALLEYNPCRSNTVRKRADVQLKEYALLYNLCLTRINTGVNTESLGMTVSVESIKEAATDGDLLLQAWVGGKPEAIGFYKNYTFLENKRLNLLKLLLSKFKTFDTMLRMFINIAQSDIGKVRSEMKAKHHKERIDKEAKHHKERINVLTRKRSMDGCDECMSDIEFIQSIQDESKQEQVWNALRQQQNIEGPLVDEDKKDVAPRYGYDSDYNLYKFESFNGSFWYTQVVDHDTAERVRPTYAKTAERVRPTDAETHSIFTPGTTVGSIFADMQTTQSTTQDIDSQLNEFYEGCFDKPSLSQRTRDLFVGEEHLLLEAIEKLKLTFPTFTGFFKTMPGCILCGMQSTGARAKQIRVCVPCSSNNPVHQQRVTSWITAREHSADHTLELETFIEKAREESTPGKYSTTDVPPDTYAYVDKKPATCSLCNQGTNILGGNVLYSHHTSCILKKLGKGFEDIGTESIQKVRGYPMSNSTNQWNNRLAEYSRHTAIQNLRKQTSDFGSYCELCWTDHPTNDKTQCCQFVFSYEQKNESEYPTGYYCAEFHNFPSVEEIKRIKSMKDFICLSGRDITEFIVHVQTGDQYMLNNPCLNFITKNWKPQAGVEPQSAPSVTTSSSKRLPSLMERIKAVECDIGEEESKEALIDRIKAAEIQIMGYVCTGSPIDRIKILETALGIHQ